MYNSLEKFFELTERNTENNRWDYKREIHTKPDSSFAELLKDILAFGNSGGGWLVIGVDDDGKIVGVESKIDQTSLGSKILSSIGIQVLFDLNYYEIDYNDNKLLIGLMYIHDSDRILVAPRDFMGSRNNVIVRGNTIYYRRNSSSVSANIDDLNSIAFKMASKGTYYFKEHELEMIKKNKDLYFKFKSIDDFLKGEFRFNSYSFSEKLYYVYMITQPKYTKYEIGVLLGFEIEYIDDYFEGRRLPKLEHLLRAVEIFKLPHDFFFQPTFGYNMPFVHDAAITYVLLEKSTIKTDMLDYGIGLVIKDVLNRLASEFANFIIWLFADERLKRDTEDSLSMTISEGNIYDTFEKYVEDIDDELYNKYKKALKTQYYKEIEKVPNSSTKFLSEEILVTFVNSDSRRMCKFLAELIKEISVKDNVIKIEFNFVYEVQNRLVRYREYSDENLKVVFKGEDKL
jgi:Putative DNA-binding domain